MSDNPYAPGRRVVIAHNPHHASAENIAGTVVSFDAGAGFMGCDLAYVRYEDPRDGQEHEMPFGTHNLRPAEPEALLQAADLYERHAAELRRLAEEESE